MKPGYTDQNPLSAFTAIYLAIVWCIFASSSWSSNAEHTTPCFLIMLVIALVIFHKFAFLAWAWLGLFLCLSFLALILSITPWSALKDSYLLFRLAIYLFWPWSMDWPMPEGWEL